MVAEKSVHGRSGRSRVAAMSHAPPGVPPHWSTDSWIHEVDDAARKAGALGGRVIVEPFATPVRRSAVLADPRGAVFTISKVSARR